MKLRNKVLIAISLAWTAFLVVTYTQSRAGLLGSFLKLEHDRVNRDLGRVDQALDQLNQSLYTFTSDWAHWNDLYDFMQGKNPNFVANNLRLTAYLNSTINLLTYWNLDGELVAGTAIDTDNKQLIAFPPGLEQYIYPGSILLNRDTIDKDKRGYILIGNKIMLVATSPITDGDKTLAPIGTIITGRILSPQIIQTLEDMTKLSLELFVPAEITKNPSLQSAFDKTIRAPNKHYNKPINDKELEGFSLITDISGKPIALFRMTAARPIYLTGLTAIHYFLAVYIALGILFSVLMIWVLRILVIKRLERLDNEIAQIAAANAVSARVNAEGNDELSSVANEINSMMDIIQASQEQLEQRVKQRTKELQESNTALQQEIMERKSIERELLAHKEHLIQLAHFDALTALPNRVFFNEIFNKALKHANRQQQTLAILFVDLDRFKNINDALGHSTGDLVLKQIAHRLSLALRSGDILARLGGDEFIVLLADTEHPKFVSEVASKLLQVCTAPVKVNTNEFFLTASIGICLFPQDGASLEDLQKNADMAMYKAKRAGGNNYQYFTHEMNVLANEHIQLEAALRKAITNNEFILYYQPKLNLETGEITGVEALIRWDSPELGIVNPDRFIPLAEETGLIIQIGEWALREACKTNKAWQNAHYKPLTVSVNLSPKQFRHPHLAEIIETILTETGLAPNYLELEITETAIIDNVNTAIEKMNKITNMGIEISLDDFGTGYTSISYLKQFPISCLKIDKMFIKGIPDSQNDLAITSAVIALAHNLGLKVVAEGVETAEQMQYLAEHNCDLIQGYFLSRPLSEKKIVLQFSTLGDPREKEFN